MTLGELEQLLSQLPKKLASKAPADRFVNAILDGGVVLAAPDIAERLQQLLLDEGIATNVRLGAHLDPGTAIVINPPSRLVDLPELYCFDQ